MTTDNERYVDYLDFTSSTWKRPEGPTRVWQVVDGRRKTASGDIPKFSIQEVPEELWEDVVDFMVEHFLPDEPMCSSLELRKNDLALREIRTMWRDSLRTGITVIALTVNSDPSVKPVIAGANVLTMVTAEDKKIDVGTRQTFRSLIMRTVIGVHNQLIKECDVMGEYGVNKYMGAYGLGVHRLFRGQGLGDALLRARNDIGRAYDIPVTETVFTATVSQFLASRVGFEVLHKRKFTELFDEEGNVAFPGVKVEYMMVMAKRLYS